MENKIINLLSWAYIGDIEKTMAQLAKRSRPPEYWGGLSGDGNFQYYMLYQHQLQVFRRVQYQNKVLYSSKYAGYHTGLYDETGLPIICLFKPNMKGRSKWLFDKYLSDVLIIQSIFGKIPETPTFVEKSSDLVYDLRAGKPEWDWVTIILNVIDRYPEEFVRHFCPKGFEWKDVSTITNREKHLYYSHLREALCLDEDCVWRMKAAIEESIDNTMNWVAQDYTIPVPIYYPIEDTCCLAVPLCLFHKRKADMALVVAPTSDHKYIGLTTLQLDYTYLDARFIARPHSEWLDIKNLYRIYKNKISSDSTINQSIIKINEYER